MMAFYRFKVSSWDHFEDKEVVTKGFVHADGYGGAAEKLEKCFSDDLLSIDLLYETDCSEILFDDDVKDIFEEEEDKN
jgi:hypothetical protein